MADRFSPSAVLRELRAGPAVSEPPTARKVSVSAAKYPEQYRHVLTSLYYKMLETQFKSNGRDTIKRHAKFVNAWRGDLDDDASQFLFGAVDAYSRANRSEFFGLDWEMPLTAPLISSRVQANLPGVTTAAGLSARVLLGQIQSTYSRESAAETFMQVRVHPKSSLVSEFFWDTGALTYYSESEVSARKRSLPSLSEMNTWSHGEGAGGGHAIVISMDASFYRIYAPMILFNAQQLPKLDFVIVICASKESAQVLHHDAEVYLNALSDLNRQSPPQNVRFLAVDAPDWVGNLQTFYACARFLVLPELLEQYENVYAIDADLFLVRDPSKFLAETSDMTAGFPKTSGLLGVPPWRRYMAGNFVANRDLSRSVFFQRMLDYLSVGLSEPKSWMLDQNAITYAMEGATTGEASSLSVARPTLVGPFMSNWERNYSKVKSC